MTCYVYLWLYSTGVPLYVGWGRWRPARKRQRYEDHLQGSRNRQLAAAFRRYGADLPVVIIRDDLTPAEAKAIEAVFIVAIGRTDLKTGPLANRTNGGDGLINPDPITRQRISNGHRGRKNGPPSEETKRKIGDANRGRKAPHAIIVGRSNKGRLRSQDFKDRISATMTGRTLSDEHRRNLSKPRGPRGPMPEKQRQAISDALTGRIVSEETKEKLRLAAIAAWAIPEIRDRQVAAIQNAAPRISESMRRVRAKSPKGDTTVEAT